MNMKQWTVHIHETILTEYEVAAVTKQEAQLLADDYEDLPAELADRVVKLQRHEDRYHLIWPAD